MTDWPSSLPQSFERDSYQEGIADNRLKSSMEYGPPKRRRRTTSSVYPISGRMVLTQSQWVTLKTFYKTTIQETGTFNFPDPDGGSDLIVAFEETPSRRYRGPTTWWVNISLEVQP